MARTSKKATEIEITNETVDIETSVDAQEINEIESNTVQIVEEVPEETFERKPKKLDMDEKITLRNIAGWIVGFNKIESNGEVNINPNGTVRVPRAEVVSQYENGNKLLRGVTNDGKHATVYIDDEDTRNYLDISTIFIDRALVRKIFAIEGLNDFKKKVTDTFVTRAEKMLLIKLIKECNFNDFNKIRECEIICGMTV